MYEIKFCWAMKLPKIIYIDGISTELTKRELKIKASSGGEAIRKLKGTDTKILSMINTVRECTQ